MKPQQIITLPIDECREAIQLVVFTAGDERSRYGQVRLFSDGTQRTWAATDSFHAGLVQGGPDIEVYDVAIPPALLRFTELAEDGSGEVTLLIDNTSALLTVTGPGGAMTVAERPIDYPDIVHQFTQDRENMGSVTLRSHRLHGLLNRTPRVVALEGEDPIVESPPH